MPLSKVSSRSSSDIFAKPGTAKRTGSPSTSTASAPEKRKLSPEEREAISGITRWATLKNWPSDPETRKALIDAVLRYCTNAFAITACIAHFAESKEWIPTEFDIRTAAEEHAWSASDMTRLRVLRRDAENCEFCSGHGREPKTFHQRNVETGKVREYVAMVHCRCPYGQLRAKVEGQSHA